MRKLIFLIPFLTMTLLICSPSNASEIDGEALEERVERLLALDHVENELIVKFNNDVSLDNSKLNKVSSKAHSRSNAVVRRNFRKLNGMQLVKISRNRPLDKALKEYLKNPDVEYAEPNFIVNSSLTPNDPDFNSLWGLHNVGQTGGTDDADIDAPEAWDITTGSANVVIAVIDSGVAINSNISVGHPDIASNIWTNPGETSCTDNIDNDNNGYTDDCYGWDFLDNDNDPMDYNGHGSHVTGTIAAVGNNNEGITGVMWNASIMPLRFLDAAGSGNTADAISAIIYATENGAHIMNNSWGGDGFSQSLADAIDASSALIVCAAGNSSQDNDAVPFYPASYPSDNIISVAATGTTDALASFSNYGATSVDLGAPGINIYSTIPARDVFFFDPMTNLDNWTAESPWGLSGWGATTPNSATDSPDGDYLSNTNASLVIKDPFSLGNIRGLMMDYYLRLETEDNYDFLCIDASLDGNVWDSLICWYGNTSIFFYSMTQKLTQYDGADQFHLRFRLFSDLYINYDGAYIDDVTLTTYSDIYDGTEYVHYNGTSMATPHVSGVAGLLKAANPSLTTLEIKDLILDNVDIKSSLSGKVISGGRLNAYNALVASSCANLPLKNVSTGTGYSTLQDAFDAAVSGDVILAQGVTVTGNLISDLNKSVEFEGGYDCDFSYPPTGTTVMNGDITVINETITIGNFILN